MGSSDEAQIPLYYGINALLKAGADLMYANNKTNPPTTALSIAERTKNKVLIGLVAFYMKNPVTSNQKNKD